ncbi:hypothetical protein CVT26_007875, partial [Gymnopilus dilepis]
EPASDIESTTPTQACPVAPISLVTARAKPSPISMLSNDILWLMFMQNTEDYSTPATDQPYSPRGVSNLVTAVWTSQVCKRWRTVILRASSLWGRLVDLSTLRSDSWRREVLLRSKQSRLWVTGSIQIDATQPFFVWLLHHHWARIQVFDVQDRLRTFDTRVLGWWAVFNRPAPVLEVFKLDVYRNPNYAWARSSFLVCVPSRSQASGGVITFSGF